MRKLLQSNHLPVKKDLKRSFIDLRPGFVDIGARMRTSHWEQETHKRTPPVKTSAAVTE